MTVKGNQTLFLYKIHTHFKGVSMAGSHIQATLKCERCNPITACMTVKAVTYILEATDKLLLEVCSIDGVFSDCMVEADFSW